MFVSQSLPCVMIRSLCLIGLSALAFSLDAGFKSSAESLRLMLIGDIESLSEGQGGQREDDSLIARQMEMMRSMEKSQRVEAMRALWQRVVPKLAHESATNGKAILKTISKGMGDPEIAAMLFHQDALSMAHHESLLRSGLIEGLLEDETWLGIYKNCKFSSERFLTAMYIRSASAGGPAYQEFISQMYRPIIDAGHGSAEMYWAFMAARPPWVDSFRAMIARSSIHYRVGPAAAGIQLLVDGEQDVSGEFLGKPLARALLSYRSDCVKKIREGNEHFILDVLRGKYDDPVVMHVAWRWGVNANRSYDGKVWSPALIRMAYSRWGEYATEDGRIRSSNNDELYIDQELSDWINYVRKTEWKKWDLVTIDEMVEILIKNKSIENISDAILRVLQPFAPSVIRDDAMASDLCHWAEKNRRISDVIIYLLNSPGLGPASAKRVSTWLSRSNPAIHGYENEIPGWSLLILSRLNKDILDDLRLQDAVDDAMLGDNHAAGFAGLVGGCRIIQKGLANEDLALSSLAVAVESIWPRPGRQYLLIGADNSLQMPVVDNLEKFVDNPSFLDPVLEIVRAIESLDVKDGRLKVQLKAQLEASRKICLESLSVESAQLSVDVRFGYLRGILLADRAIRHLENHKGQP